MPLLNHHTSGVRKEWYRHDLEEHKLRDPYPIFRNQLLGEGITEKQLEKIEKEVETVEQAFYTSRAAISKLETSLKETSFSNSTHKIIFKNKVIF